MRWTFTLYLYSCTPLYIHTGLCRSCETRCFRSLWLLIYLFPVAFRVCLSALPNGSFIRKEILEESNNVLAIPSFSKRNSSQTVGVLHTDICSSVDE